MEALNGTYFINLILVGLLLFVLSVFVKRLLGKVLRNTTFIPDKQKDTVQNVTHHILTGLGIALFLLYALSPFVKLDKILAGAGVLGIVIGFASQSLIRDLMNGLFRVTTKQLHKGDLIIINGRLRGRVEEIGMMYLQIREWDGKLTTVNNGEIKDIQNHNIDRMRVIVHVVTSFRESPEKIIGLLEETCERLNESCAEHLLKGIEEQPFEVLGLTNTNEQFFGYRYTVVALVKDESYFQVLNETRRAIAQTMYDNRIQMAEQHIYFKTRLQREEKEENVPFSPHV